MSLDGQIAIVTGASRGIGRAIAQQLAAEGARVACVATSKESAAKTADDLEGAAAFGCDVSNADSVKQCADQISSELGAPSILVNNAGITKDQLVMRMKDEDFDDVIAVNLRGSFLWARAVARPMMKARTGRIINIASVNGLRGAPGQANYAASKAGVVGLTLSLARELGPRGITVNAIAPGYIQTDMTEDLGDDVQEAAKERIALGRLGEPGDIAPAVSFLASEGGGYITGQVLVVDGGLIA